MVRAWAKMMSQDVGCSHCCVIPCVAEQLNHNKPPPFRIAMAYFVLSIQVVIYILQLFFRIAMAYVVLCNCLCCQLQLPMLSVAIAVVVSCNCLCCHFIQKCAHHVHSHLHNHSTKPKPSNPPLNVPSTKQKNPKT